MADAFIFMGKKLISWFDQMRKYSTEFLGLTQELLLFNSITPC